MAFIAGNQFLLILLSFLAGSICTAILFRKPAGHRVWRIADLGWVVLGGMGALVAVVAGIYKADSSHLERQIDLAYAATADFDRDAARFRLRFCDPVPQRELVGLCDKIEYLSGSTASNTRLPLFLSLTRRVIPLQGLRLIPGGAQDMELMMSEAGIFDALPVLEFVALDDATRDAVDKLRERFPVATGDFLILARAYEALIEQVTQLKTEWEFLQANARILVLQILALCVVAFAAPFRLGKSIVELRGNKKSDVQ